MNRTTRLTPFGGNGNDQPPAQPQERQMYDQDLLPPVPEEAPAASSGETSPTVGKQGYGRKRAAAAILGSLLVGGVAGAAILGPLTAQAASPTPTTVPSTGTTGGAGTTETAPDADGPGGGGAGHVEAVTDASVAAKAIGITEAELNTALQGGQTIAAVAKAHNVAAQTVIDAMVADGLSELAAEVKAGSITQAQADAQKAEVTARATDQVNGTFMGGRDGHGGPGGHVEAVTDASVAAKEIGITEAELNTVLQGGQTIAAVAKAHNVDVQKVIDAYVADKLGELAADVKAGTLTQAQADAQKATVTQFATDQVNGTHR